MDHGALVFLSGVGSSPETGRHRAPPADSMPKCNLGVTHPGTHLYKCQFHGVGIFSGQKLYQQYIDLQTWNG